MESGDRLLRDLAQELARREEAAAHLPPRRVLDHQWLHKTLIEARYIAIDHSHPSHEAMGLGSDQVAYCKAKRVRWEPTGWKPFWIWQIGTVKVPVYRAEVKIRETDLLTITWHFSVNGGVATYTPKFRINQLSQVSELAIAILEAAGAKEHTRSLTDDKA